MVAEQEGLAWAICKWEQGRNCLWNLLGGFIYVLGCLSECLQNSTNSNKQSYLQSEPPPLCAGFGFLETRMEKNKKGGGNQLFTGLPATNQGSHKKSSAPIEYPYHSLQPHPDREGTPRCLSISSQCCQSSPWTGLCQHLEPIREHEQKAFHRVITLTIC